MVSPWYVVYRFLIEFASSLCAYKRKWDRSDTHQGPSAAQLLKTVESHLKSDFPMLLPRFRQLLDAPTNQFRWTGPELHIFPRDESLVLEVKDIPNCPVYVALSDGMQGVVAETEDGNQDLSTEDDGEDNGEDDSEGDGEDNNGEDDGEDGIDSSSAETDSNHEKSSSTDEALGEVMDLGSDSEDHHGMTGDAMPRSGMY
jgi:hypothetical protein